MTRGRKTAVFSVVGLFLLLAAAGYCFRGHQGGDSSIQKKSAVPPGTLTGVTYSHTSGMVARADFAITLSPEAILETSYTYENTEVCYRSESGEPVLFFANLNGVAYEADTQVWITDNSGNSCEWYPSLDSMSYLWPCISETGDYLSFDFTEYGWQDVSSELAPWLSDGYSGVYSWGLEGCWTTQAAAWDTGRTANYYLWFFPEDENGGSVDLDWQYEGSDLFEEMWGGYWEIASVMDGPSYVTISLSMVGGENYGVTDGPYYISDTYPLVVSHSGEEMVIGPGFGGVSLPFMPQEDPQPYTLTLDSWFTESSVW